MATITATKTTGEKLVLNVSREDYRRVVDELFDAGWMLETEKHW